MNGRRSFALTLCWILIGVLATGARGRLCWGAASEQELAKYLLLGAEAGRQKLHRGVYRGTGRIRLKTPAPRDVSGPWEVFCAFDNDARLMRFDSSRPIVMEVGKGATPEEVRQGYRVIEHQTKLISTKSEHICWTSMSGGVQIKRPEDPQKVLEVLVRPLDVRTFGLVLMGDFNQSLPFDRIIQLLEPTNVVECRREGGGIAHIDWLLGAESHRLRRRIWIDSERDFTPIRLECANQEGEGWEEEPEGVSEVTWKELDGAYVPVAYVIKEIQKTGFTSEYEIALEWLSVNAPVQDRYFAIEDFKLPSGTDVVDYRFAEPVVVKTFGQTAPLEPVISSERTRSIVWLIVAANIGIVFLLAAIVFIRRGRATRRRDQL